MRRTPALVAAAAALGLLAGLGIEARASALSGEVSPHTVAMAWLTPGAPSPAGMEVDGPGAWARPDRAERLVRLPAMRVRISPEGVAHREVHRKAVSGDGGCSAKRTERAARDVRRS